MSGGEALTPLDRIIRARIAAQGPMSVHDYMALALGHSEYGYYRRREAIGRSGDFITAPEISQVFGELIGLWSAIVAETIAPGAPLCLIEIGPGRGTLMADALRALKVVPGLLDRLTVHMVEPSPALAEMQRHTLTRAPCPPHWHGQIDAVPPGPTVIIANEVIDTLPVRQLMLKSGNWHERTIEIADDGLLRFGVAAGVATSVVATAPEGSILELRPDAESLIGAVAERSRIAPTVALLIDYGHERSGFGDTLQAVSRHERSDPTMRAGETDLSAQVDFEAFATMARAHGLSVEGAVPQAAFLGALGIVERTQSLMSTAAPAQAMAIEAGVLRLIDPAGMGSRFKVLALKTTGIASLPGF